MTRISDVELVDRPTALFKAMYNSKCRRCKEDISKGDLIGYKAGAICADCRLEIEDDEDEEALMPDGTNIKIPLRQVMPRGRSVLDRCDRCFMIHPLAQKDCE